MYTFPEDLRRTYESSPMSFVYYQRIGGRAVPVLASDGFVKNTGMSRDNVLEWLEAGMFERMHPDDVGFMSKVSDDFLHRRGQYDVIFRTRIGKDYVSIHGVGRWQTMPDGTELAVIGYSNISNTREGQFTITEKYQLFQRDQYYLDNVTGLPNLNYLKDYADQRINTLRTLGKAPAIIYFDIRSMVAYNAEYGYAKGDDLVRLTARVLKEQYPDALVTRGEGDHFILIDEFDRDIGKKSLKANKRIRREAFGRTTGIQCAIVRLLPKMKAIEGIDRARSTLKEIGDDLNVVYRYYAHQDDKDYWIGRYVIQNFEDALENGWIRVFYQPILRTRTEKITILEGLARWIDPNQGMISPGQFIPVLSQYHLLHRLDVYMVEQICREFKEREKQGLPLVPVSVNFSAQDFDYVDVVDVLNTTLEKYGLDRSKIIIEITEQDLAQATEHFKKQLERIHDCGYRLWVDDFGSGYSSLSVFNQYHVDRVKFDMEFVRHLNDNGGTNRTILKYMVEMCRQLGVHTLTEGVENSEHYEFLSEVDCEMVQGFYMFRPEPVEEWSRIINGVLGIPIETQKERSEMCSRWIRHASLSQPTIDSPIQ